MGDYQMGKRFWATQIKRTALSLIAAFALGVLFDYLAYEEFERSGLVAGLVAVALYLLAGLGIGVVNLISGLIYVWLWGGKDMKEAILHDLRSAKLPPPDEYHAKRFDYVAEVADDDEYPPETRVKAAGLYAAYHLASQRAGFFNGVALAQAADEAVLRYAQEAPQPRPE